MRGAGSVPPISSGLLYFELLAPGPGGVPLSAAVYRKAHILGATLLPS